MSKFYTLLISFALFQSVQADIKDLTLNKISEKTSNFVSGIIPGEGLTEVDVRLRDNNLGNGNYEFKILGVRDILPSDNTNLFTQFSLHTQEINSDKRFIGNLGFGYRFLNSDQSMMFGANTFYDMDLEEKHKRVGLGFEGKASMIDLNYNLYQKATNVKVISGTNEQVLSGQEYNVSSQLPYMPWTIFNFQGYRMENELASQDVKGNIYSLEMALNPSLQFDIEKDVSSVDGQEDEWNYRLTFTYPPRNNKTSLLDGVVSQEAFVKKNMKDSLKGKVRRNNNLAVEIQGAITFTAK
jgi:hypothetical protein